MTKLEALNTFCEALQYDQFKLEGETKVQFLQRMQKRWALGVIRERIRSQELAKSETTTEILSSNLEI